MRQPPSASLDKFVLLIRKPDQETTLSFFGGPDTTTRELHDYVNSEAEAFGVERGLYRIDFKGRTLSNSTLASFQQVSAKGPSRPHPSRVPGFFLGEAITSLGINRSLLCGALSR